MKTESIKQIEKAYMLKPLSFSVGDTISVNTIIREGDKKRNQLFKGIVIAIKRSGIRKTFTIRKISAGIGVEKILPLNSPNIESIKLIKKGSVRKSKIYYMRKRIGKRALKIEEGLFTEEPINDEDIIEVTEEVKAEENKSEREEEVKDEDEKAKEETEKTPEEKKENKEDSSKKEDAEKEAKK